MEVWLNTRGFRTDYFWLPSPPPERWWQRFTRWSDFEFPTILLQREAEGDLKFYVGALPSGRRDFSGTPIRVSVAGSCHIEEEEAKRLVAFLADALDWAVEERSDARSRLQERLDDAFPTSWVEEAPKSGLSEELLQRFKAFLSNWSPLAETESGLLLERLRGSEGRDLAGIVLNTAYARSLLGSFWLRLPIFQGENSSQKQLSLVYLNVVKSVDGAKEVILELSSGENVCVGVCLRSVGEGGFVEIPRPALVQRVTGGLEDRSRAPRGTPAWFGMDPETLQTFPQKIGNWLTNATKFALKKFRNGRTVLILLVLVGVLAVGFHFFAGYWKRNVSDRQRVTPAMPPANVQQPRQEELVSPEGKSDLIVEPLVAPPSSSEGGK